MHHYISFTIQGCFCLWESWFSTIETVLKWKICFIGKDWFYRNRRSLDLAAEFAVNNGIVFELETYWLWKTLWIISDLRDNLEREVGDKIWRSENDGSSMGGVWMEQLGVLERIHRENCCNRGRVGMHFLVHLMWVICNRKQPEERTRLLESQCISRFQKCSHVTKINKNSFENACFIGVYWYTCIETWRPVSLLPQSRDPKPTRRGCWPPYQQQTNVNVVARQRQQIMKGVFQGRGQPRNAET